MTKKGRERKKKCVKEFSTAGGTRLLRLCLDIPLDKIFVNYTTKIKNEDRTRKNSMFIPHGAIISHFHEFTVTLSTIYITMSGKEPEVFSQETGSAVLNGHKIW